MVSGSQHSLSANRNCETNSPPYGYGGRRADITVFPVRIIMSPTSSSRLFAGRNARSATLRTNSSPLFAGAPVAAAGQAGEEGYATLLVRTKPEPARRGEREPARRDAAYCDRRAGTEAGGMFARAVTAPRHILLLAAVLVGLAGCGKPRQDA